MTLSRILLLYLAGIQVTQAAAAPEAAIDELFAAYAQPGMPGAAVGVYQGGRVLFAKGYGLADLESGVRITPRTPFHVASVSKQFSAFAIALLASEGRLDLDADVRRYLPYLPDFGHVITVRQLVLHSSGLRDQWTLFRMGGRDLRDVLRQTQIVAMAQRQRALNFQPGTNFLYSNTGYTLLAEIVHSVTGQTLRQFTDQRMFKPLGMQSTFFYDDVRELVPGRAHSYEQSGAGTWERSLLNYETVGATSLYSTIEDLARWAANFAQPRVGDISMLAKTMRSGTLSDGTPVHYGFGLFDLSHDGRKAVSHSGGDASFRSYFIYYPESGLAVALLANREIDVIGKVKAIADLYLPPVKSRVRQSPAIVRTPNASRLDELSGSYANAHRQVLFLTRHAAGMTVREGSDTREQKLTFYADGSIDVGERTAIPLRAAESFDISERTNEYLRPVVSRDGTIVALEQVPVIGLPSTRYDRVQPFASSAAALARYVGDYHSDELDITYSLAIAQGQLIARSLWLPEPVPLVPTALDHFDSLKPPFEVLTFERNRCGAISAARLHARHAYDVLLVLHDGVPCAP